MLLHRKPQDVRMQAIDNEKAYFAVKTVWISVFTFA